MHIHVFIRTDIEEWSSCPLGNWSEGGYTVLHFGAADGSIESMRVYIVQKVVRGGAYCFTLHTTGVRFYVWEFDCSIQLTRTYSFRDCCSGIDVDSIL